MDKGLHCLVGIAVGERDCLVDTLLREQKIKRVGRGVHGHAVLGQGLRDTLDGCFDVGIAFLLQVLGKCRIFGIVGLRVELDCEVPAEGTVHERGELEVEVVARDTAVLLVALELEDDRGKRSCALDGLCGALEAGTGVETGAELLADRRKEAVERKVIHVEVVDVEVAVRMLLRILLADVVEQVIHLVGFRGNLAVHAWRGVAGLVGVVAQDVGTREIRVLDFADGLDNGGAECSFAVAPVAHDDVCVIGIHRDFA